MKAGTTVRELETQYRQLLFSLRLPDAVLAKESPAFLKHFDLNFARALLGANQPWGKEDAFDERSRIISEVLLASDDGKQLFYASEIDLLRQIRESGQDQVHRGPFGILEGVFPIKVRGHIVHCLRTGKFRDKPFTSAELKEISFLTGVQIMKVEATAQALPIHNAIQMEQLLEIHRRLRDAMSLALEEHLRASELTGEQMRAERTYSMGTLAEGMAHHFNNLLSIVLGYSSMILDRAELSGEAADALRKVTEAAQRGRRFTEEILSIAGGAEEEDTPCSIHERLNGVLTLLQSRISPRINIETKLDAKHDIVIAPPGVVHQIVFNLLTNAIDSLSGSGRLAISTANFKDGPEGAVQEYVRLLVADSSGALPKKKNGKNGGGRRIIDTLAGEDMGPRLMSIFGHVSRLEGSVVVTSDPGLSTTIEIKLPVSAKAVATGKEKKIRRRLAPSHIIVADDDPVVREMCRRVLTEDGHKVEETSSGEELQTHWRAREKRPDLIIYDFNMPDVNGLEVSTWLREKGDRVPIILLSGFSPDQPDIRKTLQMRKTFLLQKPFSFRDMSDMVTIALGETLIEE